MPKTQEDRLIDRPETPTGRASTYSAGATSGVETVGDHLHDGTSGSGGNLAVYLRADGTIAGAQAQAQEFAQGISVNGTMAGRPLDINSTTTNNIVAIGLVPVIQYGTTGLTGISMSPRVEPTANVVSAYGTNVTSRLQNSSSNVTSFFSVFYRANVEATYLGAITSLFTLYVQAPSISGSVPTNIFGVQIQNQGKAGATVSYGLQIAAQSGSATNYAIFTNAGLVRLGDVLVLANGAIRPLTDSVTALQLTNAAGTTVVLNVDTTNNRVGVGGVIAPTARLHLPAGTATASTAPLKLTTGTVLTTPEAGAVEYDNTFHVTESDAARRHVVVSPSATKTTAAAPYTNDGYVTMRIGGTDLKVMTTA